MRFLTAILLSLIAVTAALKLQPFLELGNISFTPKGLFVGKVLFRFGEYKVSLFNLVINRGGVEIGTLTLYIPPQPPEYAVEVKEPDYKLLKKALGWGVEILNRLPFYLRVKDAYLTVNNISVNLYDLSVGRGFVELPYGEIFPSKNPSEVVLKDLSLQSAGSYATLGGSWSFKPLKGSFVLSADTAAGKIELSSTAEWKGEELKTAAAVVLSTPLRGWIDLSSPAGRIGGNFTLRGFELFSSFRGKIGSGNNPVRVKGSLRGSIYPLLRLSFAGDAEGLCSRKLLLGGSLNEEALDLALEDSKDLTYISSLIDFKKLLFWAVGTLGGGSLEATGTPSIFMANLENATVGNFCSLNFENLRLRVKKNRSSLKGQLAFQTFGFGNLFRIGNERAVIKSSDRELMLLLGGSIDGLLARRDGMLWGYLRGTIFLRGKPLRVNVPVVDLFAGKKEKLLHIGLQKLSWDHFEVKEVDTLASLGKGFFDIRFRGLFKGFASYRGGDYRVDLKGWLFQNGNPRRVELEAKGTTERGKGSFRLEELLLTYAYAERKKLLNFTYGVIWRFLSLKGAGSFGKKLNLRGILVIGPNPTGIVGSVPFTARGDRSLNRFLLRLFPTCFDLLGQKLTCLKSGSIEKDGNDIAFALNSLKGFPLYLSLQGELKDFRELSLDSFLKVKTALLNRFLSLYGTYIEKPQQFQIPFTYRGPLEDFLNRLSWSYSVQLSVLSAYLYKPLKVYLSASAFGGAVDLLLGFADALSGNVYGTLSLDWKTSKGLTVENDITELPVKVLLPATLSGYTKVSLKGRIEKGKTGWDVKERLLSGGYIKVLSYNFPKGGGNNGNSPPPKVKTDIDFLSSEPLYIETPNGWVVVTYRGSFKNGTLNAVVFINYGRVEVLGKTFYIRNGEIDIKGNCIEVDIPLVYYAPGRTVYIRIYGPLPVEHLKLDIYSVPPAPREELLAELLGGGGASALAAGAGAASPLVELLLKGATAGVATVANRISSLLLSGVEVKFEPTFDPIAGFTVGVDIQKHFDDIAAVGYHWLPTPNPKGTYLWGSMKFLYNTFIRGTRYADGSVSTSVRFAAEFGTPF